MEKETINPTLENPDFVNALGMGKSHSNVRKIETENYDVEREGK